MSFLESPRFPDRIAYGAVGGPGFKTGIAVAISGREARNAEWAYPQHAWNVSQGLNSEADYAALRAFFMTARGRLHSWRFKDWTDFEAAHTGDEKGIVTALTSTTFQMVKRYTSGSNTQDRIIRKPVSGTCTALVSGGSVVHSIDYTTGIITIASAPAAGNVTWAGEFDVPMRFDSDRLPGRIVSRNGSAGLLTEWSDIQIVEDMSA